MSKNSETSAHRALADTARMRMAFRCAFHNTQHHGTCPKCEPDLEATQPMPVAARRLASNQAANQHLMGHTLPESIRIERERRKPSTIGVRAPETHRLDTVSERDQSAVESGTWPVYTP